MIIKRLLYPLFILIYITAFGQEKSEWETMINSAREKAYNSQFDTALEEALESEALALKEFGESSQYMASSLQLTGEIYYMKADFKNAIKYFDKALETYSRSIGENNDHYCAVLNNLSACLEKTGKYPEAERRLVRAIEIKKSMPATDSLSLAKSLNNLGRIYQELGKYSESENAYLNSVKIKNKAGKNDDISYARTLLNIGSLYIELGNYKNSAEYLEGAFDIFEKNQKTFPGEYLNTIVNLSIAYNALDNNEKSHIFIEKAKQIAKNPENINFKDLADAYYNLAMIEWEEGNVAKAEENFMKASGIIENRFGNGHPKYSSCLNSLGIIRWHKGDLNGASEFLQNALFLRGKVLGKDHPDYAVSLNNLAGLMKDMNKPSEAEKYYIEAFDSYLNLIDRTFTFLSENERTEFYDELMDRFEMFTYFVIERHKENPALLSKLFEYRMATKAIIMSSARDLRKLMSESEDENTISSFDNWKDIRENLVNIYSMSASEISAKNINTDSLEKAAEKLEKSLVRANTEFKKYISVDRNSWQDVRNVLEDDEAAVEIIRYRLFDRRWTDTIFYAALVVTKETKEHPEIVLLKDGYKLENKFIKNYKNFIRHRIDDYDSYRHFYEKIDAKTGNKNKIYLSADGIYHSININTLIDNNGEYIIGRQFVVVVTNLNELLCKSGSRKPRKAALYGFPDFEYKAGISNEERPPVKIPEISGTRDEVLILDTLFRKMNIDTDIKINRDASEMNFKHVGAYDIIHLASHGYFLPENEMKNRKKAFGINVKKAAVNPLLRSGILLSGAAWAFGEMNGGSDNGILTSFEAININLESASLVVLSACETGLGKVKNGEGVYGLQRAFIVAGADNLIMSLWKIDDKITTHLMEKLYLNIVSGQNYSEALRNAQLAIKSEYRHPYFWGAFVIIGK